MWALRTETWTREQQLQASGKILLHVTAGGGGISAGAFDRLPAMSLRGPVLSGKGKEWTG